MATGMAAITIVLPAEKLVTECYYQMFEACDNLSSITCFATDMTADECLFEWVYAVAYEGIFTLASGDDWNIGDSGIPSNWTAVYK